MKNFLKRSWSWILIITILIISILMVAIFSYSLWIAIFISLLIIIDLLSRILPDYRYFTLRRFQENPLKTTHYFGIAFLLFFAIWPQIQEGSIGNFLTFKKNLESQVTNLEKEIRSVPSVEVVYDGSLGKRQFNLVNRGNSKIIFKGLQWNEEEFKSVNLQEIIPNSLLVSSSFFNSLKASKAWEEFNKDDENTVLLNMIFENEIGKEYKVTYKVAVIFEDNGLDDIKTIPLFTTLIE